MCCFVKKMYLSKNMYKYIKQSSTLDFHFTFCLTVVETNKAPDYWTFLPGLQRQCLQLYLGDTYLHLRYRYTQTPQKYVCR